MYCSSPPLSPWHAVVVSKLMHARQQVRNNVQLGNVVVGHFLSQEDVHFEGVITLLHNNITLVDER